MIDFQHWPETSGFLQFLKRTEPSLNDIASTPFEVLDEVGAISLRKYQSNAKDHRWPVLILPSIINRPFVLDLLPEKSFVLNLLKNGHDVYMVDWGIPQSHEQHLSFERLMTLHLEYLLEKVEIDCGGEKVHLMGHCLGGTIGLMASLLNPDRFASLTLITTPVRFSDNDKLSLWARCPDFDLQAFTEAYGNVPWFLLQSTFLALKPNQVFQKYRQLMVKLKDPKFVRNFWAMESWANDNVDLRGECFKVLLGELYQKNALEKGSMKIGKKTLDLRQHQLPTFVLIADADHIVSPLSHLTAEMVPKVKDLKVVNSEGGHVGALIGGRSVKTIWPQLNNWMRTCEV